MRLYSSPTSPYARKIRAIGHIAGLQWDLVQPDVFAEQSDYGRINPIHRIPALALDQSTILYDSRVIAEFLDSTHCLGLLPSAGGARWRVLMQQALGDGLMDVAVPRRMGGGPPARAPVQRETCAI